MNWFLTPPQVKTSPRDALVEAIPETAARAQALSHAHAELGHGEVREAAGSAEPAQGNHLMSGEPLKGDGG